MIKNAMIFAAGFGSRLQHHTREIPKTLLKVKGKCLIDIILERLLEYGVTKVIVNCHYQAHHVIEHVKNYPQVVISHEKELLDTGGGLSQALSLLEQEPLITVNGDTIWYEADLLQQLTALWNQSTNLAMTFYPTHKMLNHRGEFTILPDQQVIQDVDGLYNYAGIQIINPDLLHHIKKKKFSLSELYDLLFSQGKEKVYGLKYQGQIFHIGTPQELALAT